MKKDKKKKAKVTYVDDGRTIADMSGVKGSRIVPKDKGRSRTRSEYREMFETYIAAVKMMFLPMLAVLGIIAAAFLLVYFIL